MLPFVENSSFWKSCKLQDCKDKTQTHKLLGNFIFWLSSLDDFYGNFSTVKSTHFLEHLIREYKISWTHSTNQSLIGRPGHLMNVLYTFNLRPASRRNCFFLEIYFKVFFDIDYMIICSYLAFGIFIANGV